MDIRNLDITNYIQVAYTDSYDFNNYQNKMSDIEFSEWYLKIAIPTLIKYNFIVDFPNPSFNICKAYRKNSIKVFSDGKLGVCNATPYKERKPHISEAIECESVINKEYSSIKNNLLMDEECLNCQYYLICGGKYFCRGKDYCKFLSYDLREFLKLYIDNKDYDLFAEIDS